jgi:hypothetical protein
VNPASSSRRSGAFVVVAPPFGGAGAAHVATSFGGGGGGGASAGGGRTIGSTRLARQGLDARFADSAVDAPHERLLRHVIGDPDVRPRPPLRAAHQDRRERLRVRVLLDEIARIGRRIDHPLVDDEAGGA